MRLVSPPLPPPPPASLDICVYRKFIDGFVLLPGEDMTYIDASERQNLRFWKQISDDPVVRLALDALQSQGRLLMMEGGREGLGGEFTVFAPTSRQHEPKKNSTRATARLRRRQRQTPRSMHRQQQQKQNHGARNRAAFSRRRRRRCRRQQLTLVHTWHTAEQCDSIHPRSRYVLLYHSTAPRAGDEIEREGTGHTSKYEE